MSGMFGGGGGSSGLEVVADPYKDIREPTINWLKNQVGKAGPTYSGEYVAPSTAQEKQSLDFLKGYVDQGAAEGTKLAGEEIKKTLTGQYDPTSSPYYQAVKAESARNLADVQSNIADQSAGGGRYWGGARLNTQGEAATDAAIAMNKLLGQMSETERARRLQAVPMAAQLGQQEENRPLQKAQALQSLGGLERELNQARDDAIYNEWVAANREYPMQIGQLASSMSKEPIYGSKAAKKNNSGLGSALGMAAGALLALPTGGMSVPMGAMLGGGLGGAAGSYF